MQPSDELKNLILQLYGKEASGGLFDFAKHLFSHHDGVSVIGTDPNEWFEDYESIIRFYEANSAAVFEIKIDELKAYSEDAFGWAMDHVTVKLPNNTKVPVRHSYVFHKENDVWKIVHTHISIAVPNESIGE